MARARQTWRLRSGHSHQQAVLLGVRAAAQPTGGGLAVQEAG